jgi:hypothetical protein
MKGCELRKIGINSKAIYLLTGYDSTLYSTLLDLTDFQKQIKQEENLNSTLNVGLSDQYQRENRKIRHFHAYYALKHLSTLPHFDEAIFRVECNKQRMTLSECAMEGLVDKVYKIFVLLDSRTKRPINPYKQEDSSED